MAKNIRQKGEAVLSPTPSCDKCRISIEITNICNHKCVFCPSARLTRKRRFIDEDLCYRIIKEGYDLGVREITFHMLGEPFLNKNLANYIRAAKSIGYSYVYETTNGALATPDKLRDVFSAGLDSVKFSINASTRESYLSTHGKDDFEIVKKHIAYCREYRENSGKRFNIFVSYVATSQTIDDAKQFKNEFSNYADSVAFYAATARSGVASGNQLPINRDENRSCMQPFNAICVSCEGILTPCCIDPHLELAMDDLHNISLKDAWYSSKMTKFRQMHIDKKLDGSHCEKCLRDGSNWLQLLDL